MLQIKNPFLDICLDKESISKESTIWEKVINKKYKKDDDSFLFLVITFKIIKEEIITNNIDIKNIIPTL